MSGLCEKLGDNSLFFTIITFAVCNCFTDAKTVDIAETTPVTGAVEVPKINVKVSMPGKEEHNPVDLDLVEKYMHLPITGDYDNEHDMYELAKKQMLASQHDKVTKVNYCHLDGVSVGFEYTSDRLT